MAMSTAVDGTRPSLTISWESIDKLRLFDGINSSVWIAHNSSILARWISCGLLFSSAFHMALHMADPRSATWIGLAHLGHTAREMVSLLLKKKKMSCILVMGLCAARYLRTGDISLKMPPIACE